MSRGSTPVSDGEAATGAADGKTALRAGEAHALAILDAALDAVITIDHRGCVLEFNRAAEETFGYRRRDVARSRARRADRPARLPRCAPARAGPLDRRRAEGRDAGALLGRRIDVEAMSSDGSTFPAELAISRVEIAGPPIFTACIRDVSERRDAEERLQSRRVPLPHARRAAATRLVRRLARRPVSKPSYLSPQVETHARLHGRGVARDAGPLPEPRSTPTTASACWPLKAAAYESRRAQLVSSIGCTTADGSVVWVEDQSVLVGPPDGEPAFRQGFAVDITERKQAEDRAAPARDPLPDPRRAAAARRLHRPRSTRRAPTSTRARRSSRCSATRRRSGSRLRRSSSRSCTRMTASACSPHTQRRTRPASRCTLEYRLIARDGRMVWVHDEARVIADGRRRASRSSRATSSTSRRAGRRRSSYGTRRSTIR